MKASFNKPTTVLTFVLLTLGSAAHADSGMINAVSTLSYVKQDATNIADADGNMLIKGESQGTLNSKSIMNGAKVLNQEVAQLYMGNGNHQGYFTVSNNDGSTITKWNGEVTTVMKDNIPMTSFKGKWEYIKGTGKFSGIKGNGDYSGHFTSPTEYVVDMKGRYSM